MAPRTLTNIGLSGFWTLGEDNWKDLMDQNLLKLTALVQPVVLSRVTELPGISAAGEGDVYVVPDDAVSNANDIAVFDDGAWVYYTPLEGWSVYVVDEEKFLKFDGTSWITDSPFELVIAASDETSNITIGSAKVTFYMPCDCSLSEVFTGLSGQSSSGSVTTDVKKAGVTIFSTLPVIQALEDTSLTGTAAVLSTTTFLKGDKITIDITGAGTGAKGLKVVMIGRRT